MPKNINPAYVLSRVGPTGLATVRGLAKGHIPITAISYVHRQALDYSRLCKVLHPPQSLQSDEEHMRWLSERCAENTEKPVVIPTCDADALLLAKYSEIIRPVAHVWNTSYDNLATIVNKSSLYRNAAQINIPVLPSLNEPSLEQLERWCTEHQSPYLLKPFYAGIPQCTLKQKNRRFDSRSELLDYAKFYGMEACVVQRLIAGGDGYVVDTYGLSDSKHRVLTYAHHRRWRQFPPHVGATCYGEIPAHSVANSEVLFEYTQQLVGHTKFHGIFGIEWLLDQQTRQWYLIDFNARPFSSIGHLTDCGLNLPLLAYLELAEQLPDGLHQQPALKHYYWVDLLCDCRGLSGRTDIPISQWLLSVLRCRSFAYWSWRDPGPGIYRFGELLRLITEAATKTAVQRYF